jgi:hypothetical protein
LLRGAEFARACGGMRLGQGRDIPSRLEMTMAKSQKRSNREVRKPKAEKTKTNASQPSTKPGGLGTVETIKTR